MSDHLEHIIGDDDWVRIINSLVDVINALGDRFHALEHWAASMSEHVQVMSDVLSRHHGDELVGELRLVEQPETPLGPFLTCPGCGETHDMHTAITSPNSRPKPGDVMVCISCAAILLFDVVEDNLATARIPTDDELESLSRVPEVQALVEAITRLRSGLN
jgi:hypothetical protein